MTATDRRSLAAVFAGGTVGALARTGLVVAFPAGPGEWPWVTFGVNVVGAFALGVLAARMAHDDPRRLLAGTGFCSTLTTFSTVQIEVLDMIDAGSAAMAIGYVAASVAAGLAAVALATRMASEHEAA